MADMKDDVAQAVASQRKLAASLRVRQEDLEASLTRLKGQREDVTGAGGPEAERLGAEVDARIAAVSTELAAVTAELRDALAEIGELKKLGARAGALPVVTADDFAAQTAEEIALDNARAHISELDAQAALIDELKGSAAARSGPSREEAEAEGRARFEELRKQRATPSPGPDADPPAPAPPSPPPRKKTL